MTVSVRALELKDEAAWRRHWAAYCAFYQVDLSPSVTEATWQRLMDATSPIGGLVAVHDGLLVGICNYVVHPNTWSAGDVCYLEDLFVDPSVRGGGIGKALIDRLIAMGAEQGWARVYWHTHSHNATARRLYDQYTPADEFVRYSVCIS